MSLQTSDNKFWWKWILNYSLGELLVIGIATTIGRLVMVELSDMMSQSPSYVTPVLVIVIGAIEGLTIGFLQWRSMKLLLSDLKANIWILITVAATTLGWFLVIPPTIFLIAFFVDFGLANEYYSFIYSLLAGAAFGGIIGFAQFFVLKKFYRHAFNWVLSNIVGWMFSFFIVYAGIATISGTHSVAYNSGVIVLACVLSGLGQGLITGISLHYLMSVRKGHAAV
jgi:hypothetical protein